MKRVAFLAALGAATLTLTFVLVALRGEGGGAQAAPPAQATTVQVTVQQFSVTANPSSAPAGDVDFVASNAGSINHEFVIIRTNLAPGALPVVGGQVDESGAGVQVIDEIQPFAPGTQQTKALNLASGAYVLICNVPGHYQAGMRTGFTVTEATATATTTATPTATATETATTTATATATATTPRLPQRLRNGDAHTYSDGHDSAGLHRLAYQCHGHTVAHRRSYSDDNAGPDQPTSAATPTPIATTAPSEARPRRRLPAAPVASAVTAACRRGSGQSIGGVLCCWRWRRPAWRWRRGARRGTSDRLTTRGEEVCRGGSRTAPTAGRGRRPYGWRGPRRCRANSPSFTRQPSAPRCSTPQTLQASMWQSGVDSPRWALSHSPRR